MYYSWRYISYAINYKTNYFYGKFLSKSIYQKFELVPPVTKNSTHSIKLFSESVLHEQTYVDMGIAQFYHQNNKTLSYLYGLTNEK